MAYLGGLAAFRATAKKRLSPTSPASIPSGGPGRNHERRGYRPADTATRPGHPAHLARSLKSHVGRRRFAPQRDMYHSS